MPQRNIPAQFPRIESERALEPWGVRGLSFASVGVGTGMGFYRFLCLGFGRRRTVAGRATFLTPSRPFLPFDFGSRVGGRRLVSKGNSFAPVSDMLTNQSRDRRRHGPGTCIVRKTEKNSYCRRSSANKNSVRKWCFAPMLPLPSRRFTRLKGRSMKYVLRQPGQ